MHIRLNLNIARVHAQVEVVAVMAEIVFVVAEVDSQHITRETVIGNGQLLHRADVAYTLLVLAMEAEAEQKVLALMRLTKLLNVRLLELVHRDTAQVIAILLIGVIVRQISLERALDLIVHLLLELLE